MCVVQGCVGPSVARTRMGGSVEVAPRFCTNPLRLTRRRSTSRGRRKATPPLLPSKTLCLVAFLASVCVKQHCHVVFPPLSSCAWACACVYFLRFSCSGRKRGRRRRDFERPGARPQLASTRERGVHFPLYKVSALDFFLFGEQVFPSTVVSQAS